MSKPKLFNFGACDLLDSLMNKAVMNVFDLQCIDLEERPRLYPSYSTSLLSLYTPIGSLGSEALEYFVKDPNLILDNRPFFEEISKFDYIGHWTANAGPNDFLVINFSTEFYTKYFNKKDFLLIHTEDLYKDHQYVLNKCFDFLELPYIETPAKLLNESSSDISALLSLEQLSYYNKLIRFHLKDDMKKLNAEWGIDIKRWGF